MKVRDCMCNKVYWVEPNETVNNVAKLMQEKHVGCIPVCDEGKNILGLITDRDIVLRGVACDKDTSTMPVSSLMTKTVYTITPEVEITEASKLMCDYQIKRVPVLENNAIVGIVTLGDLANNKVDDQDVSNTVEGICRWGANTKNDQ